MEHEMKPCPFCGSLSEAPWKHDKGCYIRLWADVLEDWYTAGIGRKMEYFDRTRANLHKFDRHSNEELINAWNTRYEPTCQMIPDPDYDFVTCSVCGYEEEKLLVYPHNGLQEYDGSFCPQCGAEVVQK